MEDKLTYDDKMIEDLTNTQQGVSTTVQVGEKVKIVETLQEKNIVITIYNNKPGTRREYNGITVQGTNISTGKNTWDIYLQNGGGQTTIFNEVGDIYFKIKHHIHYTVDKNLINKELAKTKDIQQAY
ncbi:MAG TPA: hypothetical protein VFD91_09110, partial [Mariniphaga sp.]|nr:hypothetical protein [Mariniphaga sp.]